MINRGINLLSLSAALIFMNQSAQAISEHTKPNLNKKMRHKLVEHFLDKDDDSVSWKCIARGMAHNLSKSGNKKYQELGELFKSLSASTSPIYIGDRLLPYDYLLDEGYLLDRDHVEVLRQYSIGQLGNIVQNRIDQNGKVNCKQMMKKLFDGIDHDEL